MICNEDVAVYARVCAAANSFVVSHRQAGEESSI
jgi:hypothetical protein